jgi:glycosyltransferase involved in cell wall biosynthesis
VTEVSQVVGITVVVPSFNQGRFIDATLASLLDQQYPTLQILVMDGGSTDDTVTRLQSYGPAIEWVSEKDEGQSDAIVKGFSRARHPWLTWLNSDDIQCNRALWQVTAAVAADAAVEVVVGGGHYMDADGRNPRPYPTIEFSAGDDVAQKIFANGYMAQPSVFFRADAYRRAGGVDRTLGFCMDYDLWARLAVTGARFARISTDLSGNRWHDDTKTASQYLELLAEVVKVQVRHFGRVSPYYVQAVSDNLYSKLHAAHFGDTRHLVYRWVYFKTVWCWLNMRRPGYCLRGLLFQSLAKSGPLVNDTLTWREAITALFRAAAHRRPPQ